MLLALFFPVHFFGFVLGLELGTSHSICEDSVQLVTGAEV